MKAKKWTKETIRDIGMYERAFPEFEIGDCVAVSLRILEISGEIQEKINKIKKIFFKKNGRNATQEEVTKEMDKSFSAKEKEGIKERLQSFEGDVIARHNKGASSTFTVRKIGAQGVAVERILPTYSPLVDSIKVIKKGDVRRAKLFYVRDRVGKAARIKERKKVSSSKVSAQASN